MNRYSTHLLVVAILALVAPNIASAQEAQAQEDAEQTEVSETKAEPDYKWLLDLRFGESDVGDAGIFAVSDANVLATAQYGVGYDFADWVPGLRGFLTFDMVFREGERAIDRFDGAALMDWQRYRLMLVADFGREFFGFLRPAVRVGAGYSLQALEAELGNQPAQIASSHDFAGQGAAALEATWYIGYLGDVAVALSVIGQWGYQFQTGASFDELTFEEGAFDSNDPWSREGIALGSIDTDGIFWDMGIGFRLGF